MTEGLSARCCLTFNMMTRLAFSRRGPHRLAEKEKTGQTIWSAPFGYVV